MKTGHFTFIQLNFGAVFSALARCLRKGIFDWGFKKMWIMDIFHFLLSLKFQRKPRWVSCMSKTIKFSGLENHLVSRFADCSRKLKIVPQKSFKTFSIDLWTISKFSYLLWWIFLSFISVDLILFIMRFDGVHVKEYPIDCLLCSFGCY